MALKKIQEGSEGEMARIQRTSDELKTASDHLHYEWTRFHGLCERLVRGSSDPVTVDAWIESFAIHARNLLHFSAPTAERPDDVLASDYFSSVAAWEQLRGPVPDGIDAIRKRVNGEIVHLSYVRLGVTPDAKRWNVHAIHEQVRSLLGAFVRSADRSNLDLVWNEFVLAKLPLPAEMFRADTCSEPVTSTAPMPRGVTMVNTPTPRTKE